MSDRKNTTIDPRIDFICNYILKTMNLKIEKWIKMFGDVENKELITNFLDNPGIKMLIISMNNAGQLTPILNEFPSISSGKGKTCYFIRREEMIELTEENLIDNLIIGENSPNPIKNLSVLVGEAYVTILTNKLNLERIPKITIKNVKQKLQELRNSIVEINGNINNTTILPLPIKIKSIRQIAPQILDGNMKLCTKEIKSSMEDIVMKWSNSIEKVLEENSYSLFDENENVQPNEEINFWNIRMKNLKNIYQQLCDSNIRIIATLLEKINSVYYSAFSKTFKDIVCALNEAQNITLYLCPLQQQIDLFSMTDFNETKPLIEPLIHMISLIWSNSQYYCSNERMVHLFKLIQNMLIQEASIILDPGSMFQGEVDESLIKVNIIIDIFMHYKITFEKYRKKLPTLKLPKGEPQFWTFNTNSANIRLDRFIYRLNEIKDIFVTANEFLKLEKVEIGGLRGRQISRNISNILEDFQTIYREWSTVTFDVLDIKTDHKEFELEQKKFQSKSNELERKLATQIHLAFDECVHLLQMTKLIQMLGSLLYRPIIRDNVKHRYDDVLNLFSDELKTVKDIFDSGKPKIQDNRIQKFSLIDRGLPLMTGTIKWIHKLCDRLQKPFEQFSYIDHNLFEDDEGKNVLSCYETLISILRGFENYVYTEWKGTVSSDIVKYMKKPLLRRNDKFLMENFDFNLSEILKETKILTHMNYENIPKETLKLFEKDEILWEARLKLFRIIEWYNEIIEKTQKCEFDLIKNEFDDIDKNINPLLSTVIWDNYNQNDLELIYDKIKHLHQRVIKSQENVEMILKSIREWGIRPLFTRKFGHNKALLDIENRFDISSKRLNQCIETKKLIYRNMDENFRLFNNLPLISCPCSDDEDGNEDEHFIIDEEDDDETDDDMENNVDAGNLVKKRVGRNVSRTVQTTLNDEDKIIKTKSQLNLFHPYEKYVDNIVGKEMMNAVFVSLKYIKNEMENLSELNLPLFEVKFELQKPYMIFIPNLDTSSKNGFLAFIESLIVFIYGMCDMIPRIAQPEEPERIDENKKLYIATYESILNKDETIENIRSDILTQVKLVMIQSNVFIKQYRKYEYIWTDDKDLYLEQFLKYGRILTMEENQLFETNKLKLPEVQPTLNLFKAEIDKFKLLEEEILTINDFVDFQNWFRILCKGFKYTVLNEVSDWVLLFKNYLINHVTETLEKLENFCKNAFTILAKQITKDDFEEFLNILSILNEIEERQIEANETPIFEPLRDIIEMLKLYHIEFPDKIHLQLNELPDQWVKLKKNALIVQQVIAPIQTYQVDLIRKRILLYGYRSRMFRRKFQQANFFKAKCDNVYETSDQLNNEVIEMEFQLKHLTDSAGIFDIPPPDADNLIKTRRELKFIKQLWDLVFIIQSSINNWKKTPWKKIDVEGMDRSCKIFGKDLRTLDKDIRRWDPYVHVEASLKNLMTSLRAVTELQNPSIRERHWQELMRTTNVQFSMDDSTTLANLLDLNLHKYEDDVKNIVDKSVKEMAMEKLLKDLNTTWKTMKFEYELHTRTNLNILKTSEELIEILEDNQIQLQNMLSSKFVGFFLNEVQKWQNLLSNADQVLDIWFEVQRKWMYLESIFIGSEDIRKQLPDDTKRFDAIDYDFKNLLKIVLNESNVVKATNTGGLFEKLEKLQAQLTLCEKALNDYLETKRLAFPRFYFVSSADLLDILSNGNQPTLVTKHLPKLYDSLAHLKFKGEHRAYAMISKENDEHVEFKNECDCSGQVEAWLNRITDIMKATLRDLFSKSVKAYEEKPRDKWISEWPAQPALCTTQIWWSLETNDAFAHLEEGYENALKDYQKKQINQLNALIVLLLDKLTAGDRQKIMTVCTIDVHSRDVVAKLITQKVENALAFQWQCQLRHSWDINKNDCIVNICDASFNYDFEYLGNTPRLVITPLTDRCYITLTQSLHLTMGGAPAGPAGTGKTETTKDLGKGLGIMVYVFNCSEQMDYKSCGNIYKGLAQTGAWGCFDEFNRISIEVLSVVAVQVKTILDAIKNKKAIFQFMGEKIKLTPTVGLFITMNPGYAGRTELPENLKALFRPCAMVVPDFALISEIMLVAEGFQEARLLSRKFITLYTLCKELLSKQDHYDWGLRAIKSVLVVAGALRRSDPNRPEDQVLMRALRDFNIPKISTDDVPIFMGLIGDLFPNLDVPRKRDANFEAVVKRSARDLYLQPEDGFVLKIIQLKELFEVRHSVFIVGFSGTGKTEVWKTLNRTYYNLKLKPHYDDLNPKAVTNDELFGIINPTTREWKDGLFSFIMRDQVNMRGNGPKWIVLDGDIDPMWIESLNTLMDDNKILTLASNERIALTKEMRLVFEIASLRTATPATVSRAGILYINPQDLGWNPYVASWIDRRDSQTEKPILTVLFDKYIPPLLDVMKHRLKKITPISEIAMIQMTCHLLDCLLTSQNVPPECPKGWYEIYFTFAVIWGFGSALFQDQIIDWRNEFNKWWMNEFKTVKYPTIGTVFNYYIDPKTKAFTPWTNLIPSFDLDVEVPLQSTLVNTADTTCLRYFMDILIASKHPVMLVGGSGSGKSVIVYDKLNAMSSNYLITNVPFNFYTNSEMLQLILEKPLEKKAGRNFGPPSNKTMIYFIDDMNMPEVDMYGTVQPHTLIRQFMDYSHWYDRSKLTLKGIHNCQFVSCMNPTAGSFTINPRLQRHFCTFAVNFPGSDAMYHIYYNILSQHLANPLHKFNDKVKAICETLIKTAITLHQRMNQLFLPTAVKFHYIFNLRDMANIYSGMMFANGECCSNPNMLIRLWIHEVTRVYGDKLVDANDIDVFTKLLSEVVRKGFDDYNEDVVFRKPLIYFHFAENLNDSKYMPIKDIDSLSNVLAEAQSGYNDLIGAMNLVLFEDAMAHICRISRILSNDRGYALLIGVGGSGKQSLTRLAAFILSLDVFQTQLRKGFSIADLKSDLAALYMKAGIKSSPCCYLMTDSQIAEEEFLVLINDLLASGEIPDLFPQDEVDNIISAIANEVKQARILDTKENCWKFFIDKVRRMLKVVLCFSPVGSTLRIRSRKFPAIVNCTAIDWFHEWPKDALESVSKQFLADIEVLPLELVDSVSRFMAYVHGTVNEMSKSYLQNEKRYNYTTPKSFLELISLYSKLLTEKQKGLSDHIIRLENGLLKLKDCSNQVDGLREQLKEQEIVLNVKKAAANKQHAIVSAENEKVQVERNIASQKEKEVRIIEEDVSIKAKSCAEDLKKAEPVMLRAVAALDTLDKKNLTELRSFGSPPQAVVNVLAAVLVLFSRGKVPKDKSWKACKTMMGKVDTFLDDLKNYDKKNIHPNIITALQPYLKDPEFDPEIIAAKSLAAGGLCAWVTNIYKFYEVYLDVGPKERALNSAETELKDAQNTLAELNNRLSELQGKIDVLQTQLDAASAEKEKCQAEADKTEFTIQLAYRLVDGLASENIRWKELVKSLNKQIGTLPGDILLISCFISYVGCFTRSYRLELQHKLWLPTFKKIEPQIPVAVGSDPLEMICDDAQIAVWNNEGLPTDRMSAENATILMNSARWPLIIDPQLQGIKWIKQKYADKLIVTRLTTKSCLDVIERAVENGDILLIENIGETVDAVLDPLLGRVLIKKGKCLKIGDKEIDYNLKFQLILHTKLANPHYKPEMQAQTTLINFTVTKDGLEDQLLAEVVKAERPDLEELKTNLTTQQNTFKITLKMLEDDLLQRLSSAGENVLEDATLVLNLEKTKKTAAEIEIKVAEAKSTSVQIDEAREQYRPAALRAAILYFILNDLYKINRIYQFSLKAFTVVFNEAIVKAIASESISDRVFNLIDSITYYVFMYTSRALFEQDKIIFMAQMTIKILLQSNKIKNIDLDFLLRFPYTPNLTSPLDFISNIGWGGIISLSTMEAFKNIDKDIEGSHKRWRKFTESECPEREKLPGEWKNKNAIQKLCIMRALRPDRMTYAVMAFVEEQLGTQYVEARMLDFVQTFPETSSTTHTFFTLSPGVDPLKDVESLGKKLRFSTDYGNFHSVSLGQGQEIVAENAIDVAAKKGHWVILQNIHLVAKWLPTLEKKIEATLDNSHENYRLYISAEPAASAEYHIIPQGVLESAIKITNEPPTGMLANLHKSLDNFSQETLELCTKEAEYKAILFTLCYFHAVVAERRKFGPQGWNRTYPFNFGDLTISVYVLYNYLEANNRVPWEDLRYLFGEIMYGGHITDDWDRRLCNTYLEEFMQNDLIDGDLYLAPNFLAPPNTDYMGYHKYIDDNLPTESPYLYGLHPNAEIGVLTTRSEEIFKTIFELQPRDSGSSSGATVSREDIVKSIIEDIVDKIPEEFNMFEIMTRVEERTPFIIVAFQECERMNILMHEIKRSLSELFSGLEGELTITSDMEKLEESLYYDIVPENWTKLAYPSLLGLQSWYADLTLRLIELEAWAADFKLPASVWLAGFFNPQSFLTAIMQQTARKNAWPLDRMCLNCDVTKKQREDFNAPPREGAYVHGLFMEGARWDTRMGTINDSILKELFPAMPVIYLKAVTQDKQETKNIYECPVYKIRMRGPTFVWTFNLKSKQKASKWTMAGVCLLLQI